jgi:hypothetical protein
VLASVMQLDAGLPKAAVAPASVATLTVPGSSDFATNLHTARTAETDPAHGGQLGTDKPGMRGKPAEKKPDDSTHSLAMPVSHDVAQSLLPATVVGVSALPTFTDGADSKGSAESQLKTVLGAETALPVRGPAGFDPAHTSASLQASVNATGGAETGMPAPAPDQQFPSPSTGTPIVHGSEEAIGTAETPVTTLSSLVPLPETTTLPRNEIPQPTGKTSKAAIENATTVKRPEPEVSPLSSPVQSEAKANVPIPATRLAPSAPDRVAANPDRVKSPTRGNSTPEPAALPVEIPKPTFSSLEFPSIPAAHSESADSRAEHTKSTSDGGVVSAGDANSQLIVPNFGADPAVPNTPSHGSGAAESIPVSTNIAAPSPLGAVPASNIHVEPGSAKPVQAAAETVNPSPLRSSGQVELARLVNGVGQSEMHIGLQTQAFGSVKVHTIVHESQVGLTVGSERGDLHNLMAPEMSGLHSAFRLQNLRFDGIRFLDAGGSSAGEFSGNQHSRSSTYDRGSTSTYAPFTNLTDEAAAAEIGTGLRGRLNVHA